MSVKDLNQDLQMFDFKFKRIWQFFQPLEVVGRGSGTQLQVAKIYIFFNRIKVDCVCVVGGGCSTVYTHHGHCVATDRTGPCAVKRLSLLMSHVFVTIYTHCHLMIQNHY